ncbi:thymidylate synthase [Frigoriglobus tundricola]|uniref:Thymidylate synthase n=1 Tax=Frigoriglobus tundricola TaxID=2774151 RepID=A0A6M5YQP5_9BACT|nr:thymidylate synthase [Frigoriglobus tundricola]QJW95623.1 Thymidylate synthase [Frigoriglobus tundricola]
MKQYLDLLRAIRINGVWKEQRAVRADGSRLKCQSLFGAQCRYDLKDGFPLVTTKRMPFRAVAVELLWFLTGSTNNNALKAQGVSIWDEWADPETGDLGPIYGKQWRRWEGPNGEMVDQISNLLRDIRAVVADPWHSAGRRLIVSAWNPVDIPKVKGPSACHTLAQFNVTDSRLSCQLYQRSADVFLGVPFNIACYALLTHLLAKVTGLQPGEFIHTFGDVHIYENHVQQVDEQLTREPRLLPRLELADEIVSIDGIRVDQIRLHGYEPHPVLKGEVAV